MAESPLQPRTHQWHDLRTRGSTYLRRLPPDPRLPSLDKTLDLGCAGLEGLMQEICTDANKRLDGRRAIPYFLISFDFGLSSILHSTRAQAEGRTREAKAGILTAWCTTSTGDPAALCVGTMQGPWVRKKGHAMYLSRSANYFHCAALSYPIGRICSPTV